MTLTALATPRSTASGGCNGVITDLVLRCGEGDESALAELFDLTFFLVSAIVCRGAEPSPGIDDEVVAAFVRIWRRSPDFEPSDRSVPAWIFDQVVDDRS